MAKQPKPDQEKTSSSEEPEEEAGSSSAEEAESEGASKVKAPEPKPAPKKAPPPPVEEEDDEEEAEEEDDEQGDEEESEESDDEASKDEDAEEKEEPSTDEDLAARAPEGQLAAQLGVQRYVISAYLGATGLLAYVIGRAIHDVWAKYGNKDFFSNNLPRIASVPDDPKFILNKTAYAFTIGIVIACVVMIRLYRKPSVRQWTDDVTSEMAECRWPDRKEVTSSTLVVIAASAVSATYLFILDRLWAFITNLVYGSGT